MRQLVALVLLSSCSGSGSDNPAIDAPPVGDDGPPVDAPMFDPLVGVGQAQLVMGGYQFTEGPQWREAEQDVLFTDIPANTIYRYTGTGAPTVFRMPSGNSNGLAIDGNGAVISAQHGTRSVARNGTDIVAMFEGKRLNSPNDVIVADDGTIYFTDPPYGIPAGQMRELDFMGVFRLQTNGTLTAEHRGPIASRPNGIGLSPDGKTLYVANTDDGRLYRFPINADGSLGAREMHAMTAGNPDGLAIDTGGNIFVTTSGGVEVFSPAGTRWGNIAVPMVPANCAFGGADHRTLFITARGGFYRVQLANPGLPRR